MARLYMSAEKFTDFIAGEAQPDGSFVSLNIGGAWLALRSVDECNDLADAAQECARRLRREQLRVQRTEATS